MSRTQARCLSALLAIIALTLIVYWHGLHGPYLLDDIGNLSPLKRWLDGDLSWRGVIFDNRSGLLGRPLSMASFMLDVLRTRSMNSFTFKPTNLAIHLLCGIVFWVFLLKALPKDPGTKPHTQSTALFLAALWLLTPLQVSTVLYVVQRMAQLAALFMLLALFAFMMAREQITQGRSRGQILLWIGVPALTALAALAKENGVLALPLALVLELTLFRPEEGQSRPRSVWAFFILSTILPAVLALAWLGAHPGFITHGYLQRDFTLEERLLTEPRILWRYVQTLVFPVGKHMGIYHDNFPISTNIFHPWSTLPAILAWLLVGGAAWRLRRNLPLFAAGVAVFLVGQSMESSFIGLELYFEHRNYLPSIGIWMALAGLITGVLSHLPPLQTNATRTTGLLGIALLLLYAFGTWVHAGAWSSDRLFYALQQRYNPTSPRLQSDLTARAMLAGNLDEALRHIAIGEKNSPPSEATTATIWRFLAYCETQHPPPDTLYIEFETRAHGPITNFAMVGWELLASRVEQGCPGIQLDRLTSIGDVWLRRNPLSSNEQNSWRSEYNLARMVAASGHIAEAEKINHAAWVHSQFNSGVGVFQFQLSATLGHVDICREVLAHLERAEGGSDRRLNQAITTFRQALDSGQISPSS